MYFGQSSVDGGHAFIVDGYELGKYHINWGWDGVCDGFFTLDRLNPYADGGFTNDQEITINVYPPNGSEDNEDDNGTKVIIKSIDCGKRILVRTNANSDFNDFYLHAPIENDLNEDVSLELGLALYDDSGLVKILLKTSYDFSSNEVFYMGGYCTITADIAPGEYRIVSVSRTSGDENWITNSGSSTNYVKVTIEETSLRLMTFGKPTGG